MGKLANGLDKAGYSEGGKISALEESPTKKKMSLESETELDKPFAEDISQKYQLLSDNAGWDKRLQKAVLEDQTLPEVFKVLRTKILHHEDNHKKLRTVLVTSSLPREGKSFIAANLAVSIANAIDQYSLLVDCDLRRPAQDKLFGISSRKGLVDYLRDGIPIENLLVRTSLAKLSILTSGVPPLNPTELLGSMRMETLVEELATRYADRRIIIDSPPAMAAAETAILANRVDGVVIVVRQNSSTKAQIKKTIEIIGESKILGFIFNDYDSGILRPKYSKEYAYYRHGQ